MKGFEAGSLNLSIGTIADDVLKKVDLLAERLSFIQGSLKSISGTARRSSSGGGENKKSTDLGKSLLNIGKWTAVIHSAKRLGIFLGDIVQAGSDYSETLNLWQVAMRKNLDLADEFVKKVNSAYGISTEAVMNAQATFKNMLGSLGQISDETAYKISESLVLMTADYASLYNRTLQQSIQNMQSMLAGQVRPIRSAGLDITETTLYQFYKELGGTKAMRQLNRTEKQLLSILAVYKQMSSAGAVGDMAKTINYFANQSRMMTEYWAELKTWSGLILKDLLTEWGVLTYINALLMTVTEVIKQIALSRGLGKENYLTDFVETADEANKAVDELQGKLLDFDKFRALESAGVEADISIDEKVLEALTGYKSNLEGIETEAQKLTETWLEVFGIVKDANGTFTATKESIDKIVEAVDTLLGVILVIAGLYIGKQVVALLSKLDDFATFIITKLIPNLFDSGDAILYANTKLSLLEATLAGVSLAILGIGFSKFLNTEMSAMKRLLTIITALTGAFAAFYVATNLGFNPLAAISAAASIAGVVLAVSSAIPNFEKGASDIDSGTVFRAGEFGKTEAVYTGSNGKTNVANVQQMKAAELEALKEWWSVAKHDIPALQGVSDSGIYTIVDGEAKRRGKKFVNV